MMSPTVLLSPPLALVLLGAPVTAQAPAGEEAESERGLVLRRDGAFEGYTLFAPLRSTTTYLIDMDGEVVHSWASEHTPGNAVYLSDDSRLLRCCRMENPVFSGGGQGGLLQEHAWDGSITWEYGLSSEELLHHHDVQPLPDGNVLVVAWEHRTPEAAIAAGRDPAQVGEAGFWPDYVFEIRPVRPDGAEVVWEWHAWDHLIQDHDPEQFFYGDVTAHPELIDVNGDHRNEPPMSAAERKRQEEIEKQMRALGYVGGDDEEDEDDDRGGRRMRGGDWLHTNSIDYHAGLDLILLSVPNFNELWVIDHSTTTAEAASHAGGRWGRGGDLLYRWGNPKTYGHGKRKDRRLFRQHDASWVEGPGGAPHAQVFNNGEGRPGGNYSSVDEIALPFDPERGFVRAEGAAFGPAHPFWTYATRDESFFSSFISGAQRLSNGSTLVCSGADGRAFEVTPDGEIVWEYLNPFGDETAASPGPDGGRGRPGPPGEGRGGEGRRGGGNSIPKGLFRVTRLRPDHPGLADKW